MNGLPLYIWMLVSDIAKLIECVLLKPHMQFKLNCPFWKRSRKFSMTQTPLACVLWLIQIIFESLENK